MKQKWGRERYAGAWPSRKPWWTIAACSFVVLSGCLFDHWDLWAELDSP